MERCEASREGRREASPETREHGRKFPSQDENPFPKAASFNLPGDSALGVEGTSGHTFPELFPPLAESPLLLHPE